MGFLFFQIYIILVIALNESSYHFQLDSTLLSQTKNGKQTNISNSKKKKNENNAPRLFNFKIFDALKAR